MRIDDNMRRVNALLDEPIPEHENPFENTITWSKVGVLIITLPYFYLVNKNGGCCKTAVAIFGLLAIIVMSEITRGGFAARQKKSKKGAK